MAQLGSFSRAMQPQLRVASCAYRYRTTCAQLATRNSHRFSLCMRARMCITYNKESRISDPIQIALILLDLLLNLEILQVTHVMD